MPAAELWDWVDYFALEPRPDETFQIALLTAVVHNFAQAWTKRPEFRQASDFLPRGSMADVPPEGKDAIQAIQHLSALMGSNGHIARD